MKKTHSQPSEETTGPPIKRPAVAPTLRSSPDPERLVAVVISGKMVISRESAVGAMIASRDALDDARPDQDRGRPGWPAQQ